MALLAFTDCAVWDYVQFYEALGQPFCSVVIAAAGQKNIISKKKEKEAFPTELP